MPKINSDKIEDKINSMYILNTERVVLYFGPRAYAIISSGVTEVFEWLPNIDSIEECARKEYPAEGA